MPLLMRFLLCHEDKLKYSLAFVLGYIELQSLLYETDCFFYFIQHHVLLIENPAHGVSVNLQVH